MKAVLDKSLLKLIIILVLAFGLRALILNLNFAHFIGINPYRKEMLIYKEVFLDKSSNKLLKPSFNDEHLNNIVDQYIEKNKCESLDYDVFIVSDEVVSVFLDCGKKYLTIYDYQNKKKLEVKDLIKDSSTFQKNVKRLLNLKYPTFVSEEVDILNSTFDINEHELELFYSTKDYGDVSVKINNNEIKDLMTYDMQYDDIYENDIFSLDASKPAVAFTFDDGPSNYDLGIIDALEASHAKATFFLVGNRINSFKASINKMIEADMEVGNHSYNHKYMKKMSRSQVEDQINRTNSLYKEITGREMKLFRPPYGAVNNANLTGPKVPSILWSLDTLDWKVRDKDKVYETILENVQDGDIILMHSLYESTLDAVKMVLPELYKRGFQVVSVSELASLKGKILMPATSYIAFRS